MTSINIRKRKLGYFSEEAYKSLRTNLMFCGEDKKVIALTSCTPNEGKSSVSVNLSISLAEAEYKVLLIEADLRKPVLMGRAHVKGRIKGLTYYLAGQAELQEIICETNVRNLSTIFAGRIPPNPTELLGGAGFRQMIAQLREEYDYIIIDTPPLGSVIDCAVIAECCDGIIMVIETGAISYRFAREVKEQLEKAKCPILGVVLNKISIESNGLYRRYSRYERYGKPKINKKKKTQTMVKAETN